MKDWKRVFYGLHPHLLAWVWSVLLILQVVLAFFVLQQPRIEALMVAGWVLWTLGVVFAIVPIFALRTRGEVPEGKSYMKTTALVDTGLYAVVRHPQGGTAGILFNLALPLIGQHWLLIVLAAMGIVLIYADTFKADVACTEKFGEGYVRYMERVPRVNFVTGLLRLIARPKTGGVDG
ncbi:MAG: methyltransferase [Anaerolineae bacterium]|jgi:protein-S-isoprenylcysteine O-methyltransferase Ste14